jgi:serine/threonine protein kinase
MSVSRTPSSLLPASCGSMEDYEILHKCGEGTYGCVYKALHKKTKTIVALKKIVNVPKEDGFSVEVKYLTQLGTSRNVVNLKDYFFSKEGELVIIFEYMEYDLWRLMSGSSITFNILQIKCIMKQMIEGLYQCHSSGIMHRDIKPSNLLINGEGVLKLADFGLTTSFLGNTCLSNNVVSLYYRPPELLMGSRSYGPEIDMWSVGCILVELMTNNYLFAGANEAEQLDLIFRVFGTPSEVSWPGISQLPGWGLVDSSRHYPLQDLPQVFNFLSPDALDLALRLLSLDPKKRISSYEALQHPWFWTTPLPCPPSRLPKWSISTGKAPRKYQCDLSRSRRIITYRDCRDCRDPSDSRSTSRRSTSRTTRTTRTRDRKKKDTTHYEPYKRPAITAITAIACGYSQAHPIVIE